MIKKKAVTLCHCFFEVISSKAGIPHHSAGSQDQHSRKIDNNSEYAFYKGDNRSNDARSVCKRYYAQDYTAYSEYQTDKQQQGQNYSEVIGRYKQSY